MGLEENKEINKELNAESYIPPKEKPRLKMSRYTVMLIPDSTDGSKTIEITIDKIARYVVLALAAVIIITSLIVSFAVKNYRLRNDDSLQSQIAKQNVTIEELNVKNQELSTLLSDNDEQLKDLKSQVNDLELELAKDYIPSIIPYKGSAVMLTNNIAEGALSFACLEGTYVVAGARGKISAISNDSLHGKIIEIDHGNGYKTKYITNGNIKTKVNDEVDKGDRIAEIENDDDTFGYIVLLNDELQDPKEYIDKLGKK